MANNLRDTTPDAARDGAGTNVKGDLPYRDLREWLKEAKKLDEVVEEPGCNVEEEIGMAAELVMHADDAPCVVFDDIQGYPKGHRVLVNFFAGKRKNMTLGFAAGLDKVALSEAYYKNYLKDLNPIPHKFVEAGPVMENIMEGDDVDIKSFPAPLWHAGDGGRYIGTGSYSVTVDPESGAMNLGAYRVMVMDEKTVSFRVSPGQHGQMHHDKWRAKGDPMPAVIVAGGDPMTFLTASADLPSGECAYDVVGAMRGEALKVIRGQHTGLPFPADAEIVLEGFVDPTERHEEGPFGEWTGYYGSDTEPQPVMHIKAIYHRNDPIILGCPPQRPPDEMSRYRAVTRSALLRDNIDQAGVPDVTAAWAHEVGNGRMLLGVSIKQRYPGHAKQAGHIAAMCHAGAYAGKYVVITDDDVDVSDLEELTWAMITRSDPGTSIGFIRNAWSTPLDPRIPPEEKAKGNMTNSRAIIDACRPFHWKDKFPPVNAPTPDEARQAKDRFGYLLES